MPNSIFEDSVTNTPFWPKLTFGLVLFLTTCVFTHPSVYAVETVYYLHQDHLGSNTLITNTSGTVVDREVYYPYGLTRSQLASSPTERKYTGQISDQEQSGLYYYNARYYDPALGKFTQADTVNDGLNRYAYVGNNPVNKTDPSGHCDPENYFCQLILQMEQHIFYPPMRLYQPKDVQTIINNYGIDYFNQLLKTGSYTEWERNEWYRQTSEADREAYFKHLYLKTVEFYMVHAKNIVFDSSIEVTGQYSPNTGLIKLNPSVDTSYEFKYMALLEEIAHSTQKNDLFSSLEANDIFHKDADEYLGYMAILKELHAKFVVLQNPQIGYQARQNTIQTIDHIIKLIKWGLDPNIVFNAYSKGDLDQLFQEERQEREK